MSRAVRSVYPEAINAYVLPSGDIKVVFKSLEQMTIAAKLDTKRTFGPNTFVKITKKKHFLSIHGVPREIDDNKIKQELETQNIKVSVVSRKPNANPFIMVVIGLENINS